LRENARPLYPAAVEPLEEVRRMAKSKSASGKSGKGGTSGRSPARRQPALRVGKGKLEVGDRRRENGGEVKMPPAKRRVAPAASKRPRGKSSLQLPDEKVVRQTGATEPLEPARRAIGDREPMPDAAVDRRRQVVGTDDKPLRGRR
jgi:hypothetical protein